MNEELRLCVERAAAVTPQQASAAVSAVLRCLCARMPSAWVGELHAHLRDDPELRAEAPEYADDERAR
jgi:hypothetical protein